MLHKRGDPEIQGPDSPVQQETSEQN